MKKLTTFLKNDNIQSFLHTFVTDLLWDAAVGGAVTHIITNQDFSRTALYTLGYAVFRTLIRVLKNNYFEKPEPLT